MLDTKSNYKKKRILKFKMYSVHVTEASNTQGSTRSSTTEIAYKTRRRESMAVRVLNYVRSQFQSDDIPGKCTSFLFLYSAFKCFTQFIR